MRRITFLGSAPWAGKNQTREMMANRSPIIALLFMPIKIPFFGEFPAVEGDLLRF
jgi:hypothetical protein